MREKPGRAAATRKLQVWRLFILMLFGDDPFLLHLAGRHPVLLRLVRISRASLHPLEHQGTQLVVGLLGYIVGVLFYAAAMSIPWAINVGAHWVKARNWPRRARGWSPEWRTRWRKARCPNAAIASGDYGTLVMHRLTEQWSEPLFNALLFGFETLPLMLLGMALYRLGFFSGAFDRGKIAAVGMGGGDLRWVSRHLANRFGDAG